MHHPLEQPVMNQTGVPFALMIAPYAMGLTCYMIGAHRSRYFATNESEKPFVVG
jgi:hypothetical protein